MTRVYKTEGIVLQRKNYGESDKLITLFTKYFGKKLLLAKGVRRITSRRAPHLELFSHVSLIAHRGKTIDIVSEAASLANFTTIRKRLERIGFAYIALELTDKLTAENQESENIYNHLLSFLNSLNDFKLSRQGAKSELLSYNRYLLEELGFIARDVPLDQSELNETVEGILESKLKARQLLTYIQSHV